MIKNKDIGKMLKSGYLSSEEITDMVIKYQGLKNEKKKQECKDLIFENISRMIAKSVSFHNSSKRVDIEDLFQASSIGFCEAIERFDPSKGNMFTTYLKFWIDKSIYASLYSQNIIRTPNNVISSTNKMQREETSGHAVEYDKFSRAFINTTNIVSMDDVSLHDLKQTIKSSVNIEDEIEKSMTRYEVRQIMNDVLSDIEMRVLSERYFGNDELTLNQVGKKVNLCAERIRQIENNAIKKIKKRLSNDRRVFQRKG